jgi:carbon-monoxide dehydrogenase small subunit
MRLTVNGVEHEIDSPGLTALVHVLREELGITSPKVGCQQGGCGTCTVLVGGEPRRSCLLPVAAVDGAEITTVEGLGTPERLAPVQAAFHKYYGSQCGFCTPGMILAACDLLQRNPRPTEAEIRHGLEGNLCRCTGYQNIVAAIADAAGRLAALELSAEPIPGRAPGVVPEATP